MDGAAVPSNEVRVVFAQIARGIGSIAGAGELVGESAREFVKALEHGFFGEVVRTRINHGRKAIPHGGDSPEGFAGSARGVVFRE